MQQTNKVTNKLTKRKTKYQIREKKNVKCVIAAMPLIIYECCNAPEAKKRNKQTKMWRNQPKGTIFICRSAPTPLDVLVWYEVTNQSQIPH